VAWDLLAALAGREVYCAVPDPVPEGHHDHVRDVATFAHPLGELIVSVGDDRAVAVVDAVTGRCWYEPRAHHDAINATTVLPSEPPVIASGGNDGNVGLWAVTDDALKLLAMIAVGAQVTDLYAAASDLLVVGTTSGTIALNIEPHGLSRGAKPGL
jgi:WD40 repeat protein